MHLFATSKIYLYWFTWFSGLEIWKWSCLLKVTPCSGFGSTGCTRAGISNVRKPLERALVPKWLGRAAKADFLTLKLFCPRHLPLTITPLMHSNSRQPSSHHLLKNNRWVNWLEVTQWFTVELGLSPQSLYTQPGTRPNT